MKIIAVAFLCSTTLLCAQVGSVPADPKPPTPEPKAQSPTAEQTLVDSLSASELQEAINDLKVNFFKPGLLIDGELQRAMLTGILARLAPGAAIRSTVANSESNQKITPFKMESIKMAGGSTTAYLRMGSLTKANLAELDLALKSFETQPVSSVILDLRSTPESNDFELAAEVLRRFCPNGTPLFSIKKAAPNADRLLTSKQEPGFKGPLMVLVQSENAGASEVIAAGLRLHAKAILIGEKSKGEGVQFADFKLGSSKTLRIAVAEIILPSGPALYPEGVNPDIAVEVAPEVKRKVLAKGIEQGVAGLVQETERPRMNEASLVAGTNPEMDAYQNAQKVAADKASPPELPLHDTVLQRAVDLITSIGIFGAK